MLKIKISKKFFYSSYQGFSLLELMVVVAIIGILSSIAIYSYSGYTDKARISNAMSILENLKSEAVKNYLENGTFPNIPDSTGTGAVSTTPPYTDNNISNSKIVRASSYATLNTNVIGYVQITFSSTTTTELRGKVLALVAIENDNTLRWQCVNGNETGANTISTGLLPKVCQ